MTGDELVIVFTAEDAVFLGVCAGLLIKRLTELANGNITYGAALDLVDGDQSQTRKNASYLASVAEEQLLFNDGLKVKPMLEGRAELQAFHHSLVDSDNVYFVDRLVKQDLLASQADQLSR